MERGFLAGLQYDLPDPDAIVLEQQVRADGVLIRVTCNMHERLLRLGKEPHCDINGSASPPSPQTTVRTPSTATAPSRLTTQPADTPPPASRGAPDHESAWGSPGLTKGDEILSPMTTVSHSVIVFDRRPQTR